MSCLEEAYATDSMSPTEYCQSLWIPFMDPRLKPTQQEIDLLVKNAVVCPACRLFVNERIQRQQERVDRQDQDQLSKGAARG